MPRRRSGRGRVGLLKVLTRSSIVGKVLDLTRVHGCEGPFWTPGRHIAKLALLKSSKPPTERNQLDFSTPLSRTLVAPTRDRDRTRPPPLFAICTIPASTEEYRFRGYT